MLVTRITKGQVQTYEYKEKDNANNTKLNIRLNKDVFAKMKSVADYLNYNNYSQYIRDLIERELSKYTFAEQTNLNESDKTFKVVLSESE